MEFYAEDDREGTANEAVVLDYFDDVTKQYFGDESVSVRHDWFLLAVPAIQFNTLTAHGEGILVGLEAGVTSQLIGHQVCVVRTVDVVIGKGIGHVVVAEGRLLWIDYRVVVIEEDVDEGKEGNLATTDFFLIAVLLHDYGYLFKRDLLLLFIQEESPQVLLRH